MKKKFLLITLFIIIVFFFTINVIDPKNVKINGEEKANPFIIEEGSKPLIAAHRGGKSLMPQNTFLAFDNAINNYDADILELDLCKTKDGHLVLSHNETINEYTEVTEENYRIIDHTLEEIQKFNFGYTFEINGERPYKNVLDGVSEENKSQVLLENGLRVVCIGELFEKYHQTDVRYIVEIKNANEEGIEAADILVSKIREYNLEEKVIVGTFNLEVETHIKEKYPEILRGGSVGSVTSFVLTQLFKVNIFDTSDFAALQIPPSRVAAGITFRLDKKTYIDRAHRRNISVQYWTINDKEEMRKLIMMGADVIMTDRLDVAKELLEEMEAEGYFK